MRSQCDVVVVGAGLLGLASARALARRGREVIVLEQAEIGHEASGSKGSCRVFRLGYDDPGYVGLAMRAREPWAELEDECGRQLLQPTPHLDFGPGLGAVRRAMQSAGAPCELLPAAEAAARFPEIAIGGPALLEPESCVIRADAALRALAAAVPGGRTRVAVTGIGDDGRRVTIRTGSGAVTARAAIVCPGPGRAGCSPPPGSRCHRRPPWSRSAIWRRTLSRHRRCRSLSATALRSPTACPSPARRCTRSASTTAAGREIRAARTSAPTRA